MKKVFLLLIVSIVVFSCSKDDDNDNGLIGSWELKKELIYNMPIDTVNGEVEIDTILYENGVIMNIFEGDSVSVIDGINITETFYIYNEEEKLLYLDGLPYFNIEAIGSDTLILSRSIWATDHWYYYAKID